VARVPHVAALGWSYVPKDSMLSDFVRKGTVRTPSAAEGSDGGIDLLLKDGARRWDSGEHFPQPTGLGA
jgi:hypothetical protein